MSWARKHLVALVLLPALLVVAAWLVAGEQLATWLRTESSLVATGVEGEQQSLPSGSITVHDARWLAEGAPELEWIELQEGASVLLVDLDLDVASEEACTITLAGIWRGSTGEWSSDWSVGDLGYCTAGEPVSGSMGFVVPDGVTDPRLELVVGDDAVTIPLSP